MCPRRLPRPSPTQGASRDRTAISAESSVLTIAWALQAVKAVGHYGEMFERNIS